ncbi:MAG: 16S rRNA (cytidine(1402)-2'-O)-methyltransferase [Myxococcales bacterium]|nr:16S rRNA (cytidine(1402)-2'-O)-methyltransferase [Myxococcales bacterium]
MRTPPPDERKNSPPPSDSVAGRLYVVATPIGNLEDITLRALRVLGEVAVIAAEDTRSAQHLLQHHRIRTGRPSAKLLSFFVGNEAARTREILGMLHTGHDVALISEAGLPGMADPGQRLIAAARAQRVRVDVLPGACAALTALIGSGFSTERFVFSGFLPRTESEQIAALASLRSEPGTLIFYESPERVAATLATMVTVFGAERPACVARELTKLFEEFALAPLSELAQRYAEAPPRGEVTLLVTGQALARTHGQDADQSGTSHPTMAQTLASIEETMRERLQRGQGPKDISTALAVTTGLPRRRLYQLALTLQSRLEHVVEEGAD